MAKENKSSGVPGVYWEKDRDWWRVVIPDGGRNRHIGRYKNLEDAIQARLSAEQGVFPTNEEKRAVILDKMSRLRMRLVWREILKVGPVNWTSFDHFLATVGERPKTDRFIAAKDPSKPAGPDNFVWVAPEFDHQTPEGRAAYQKKHRQDNFLHYKDQDLRKFRGISIEEFQAKFDEQGGACANCGKPEKGTRNGKLRWLNVDHNHTTGQIRGLLCSNCNTALGKLQEDRNIILGLVKYLDFWDEKAKIASPI